MEYKAGVNPNVFCLTMFGWSNTCIYNSNFKLNGVIPTFRDRKRLKSEVKCVQNYRKNPNLLEVHKMRTNVHKFQFNLEIGLLVSCHLSTSRRV